MRNVQRTSYARRIKALSDERARLQRELREARAKIGEYWGEREQFRKERDYWKAKTAYWMKARNYATQWVDGREDGARIASEIARELHTEAQ